LEGACHDALSLFLPEEKRDECDSTKGRPSSVTHPVLQDSFVMDSETLYFLPFAAEAAVPIGYRKKHMDHCEPSHARHDAAGAWAVFQRNAILQKRFTG
jgi:hypothetical protein